MKKYILVILLFTSILSFGQTVKLDYEPTGHIVKFHFNGLIIYTDTTSIFSIKEYDYSFNDSLYIQRIRNMICDSLINDTAVFTNHFIFFSDTVDPNINILDENVWRVWCTISQLTAENKVVIFDSNGKRVDKVKIKVTKRRRGRWTIKTFFNKETKEELFIYKDPYIRLGEVCYY